MANVDSWYSSLRPSETDCPYHNLILSAGPAGAMANMDTMERYLMGHASERYALYQLHGSSNLSTSRLCTCGASMQAFGEDNTQNQNAAKGNQNGNEEQEGNKKD